MASADASSAGGRGQRRRLCEDGGHSDEEAPVRKGDLDALLAGFTAKQTADVAAALRDSEARQAAALERQRAEDREF